MLTETLEPQVGDLVEINVYGESYFEIITAIMPWNNTNPNYDPEHTEGIGQDIQIVYDDCCIIVFKHHIKRIIEQQYKSWVRD